MGIREIKQKVKRIWKKSLKGVNMERIKTDMEILLDLLVDTLTKNNYTVDTEEHGDGGETEELIVSKGKKNEICFSILIEDLNVY